jgi:hypothetical protein
VSLYGETQNTERKQMNTMLLGLYVKFEKWLAVRKARNWLNTHWFLL